MFREQLVADVVVASGKEKEISMNSRHQIRNHEQSVLMRLKETVEKENDGKLSI